MLIVILRNPSGNLPAGLQANSCTLLGSLGKGSSDAAEKVKRATKAALEDLASKSMDVDGQTNIAKVAAKKTLDAWSLGLTSPS